MSSGPRSCWLIVQFLTSLHEGALCNGVCWRSLRTGKAAQPDAHDKVTGGARLQRNLNQSLSKASLRLERVLSTLSALLRANSHKFPSALFASLPITFGVTWSIMVPCGFRRYIR